MIVAVTHTYTYTDPFMVCACKAATEQNPIMNRSSRISLIVNTFNLSLFFFCVVSSRTTVTTFWTTYTHRQSIAEIILAMASSRTFFSLFPLALDIPFASLLFHTCRWNNNHCHSRNLEHSDNQPRCHEKSLLLAMAIMILTSSLQSQFIHSLSRTFGS